MTSEMNRRVSEGIRVIERGKKTTEWKRGRVKVREGMETSEG